MTHQETPCDCPLGQDVRSFFPGLERRIHGHRLCYLDNAATAQIHQSVLDACHHFEKHYRANVHRGVHTMAQEATDAYEGARREIGSFLNASHPDKEIVFTTGATDALNLLAHCWQSLWQKEQKVPRVLITNLEHHSNVVPWMMMKQKGLIEVDWLECDTDGLCDWDIYEAFLQKVSLVSITHMSNVLGVMPPVEKMIAMAHAHSVPVILDGCQAIVHQRVDVQKLGCDAYVFSGHKIYGPTGIGALYARTSLLEQWMPYRGGGAMIEEVHKDRVTFAPSPQRFEAGTPNISGAIGLGEAVKMLSAYQGDYLKEHSLALGTALAERLRLLRGVKIYGSKTISSPIISFGMDGLHPHDIATLLDQQGIAVRAGFHCAQPLMRSLGVTATTRASFSMYNDMDDVEQLIEGMEEITKLGKS